MSASDEHEAAQVACRNRLKQIADALGISIKSLMSGESISHELGDTYDLLNIWIEIGNSSDRRKIIAYAGNILRTIKTAS